MPRKKKVRPPLGQPRHDRRKTDRKGSKRAEGFKAGAWLFGFMGFAYMMYDAMKEHSHSADFQSYGTPAGMSEIFGATFFGLLCALVGPQIDMKMLVPMLLRFFRLDDIIKPRRDEDG